MARRDVAPRRGQRSARSASALTRLAGIGLIGAAAAIACSSDERAPTAPEPVSSTDAGAVDPPCGEEGDPCCTSSVIACQPPLECDEAEQRCLANPDLLGATRLCLRDADCGRQQRCCVGGAAGTCVALASSCPLPDLALIARGDASPKLIDRRTYPGYPCTLDADCSRLRTTGRMLEVGVAVANLSATDLIIGSDHMGVGFQLSACTGATYVSEYVRYELLDEAGTLVASATVQPSCNYASSTTYNCTLRGIPANSVERIVDCAGVEIDDDVKPGPYVLRISVNRNHVWPESDYTNNVLELALELPPADVRSPCPDPINPLLRNSSSVECGWAATSSGSSGSCTPDELLDASCMSCTGQGPVALRVCPGQDPCGYDASISEARTVLAGGQGSPDQACVSVQFTCPAEGRYNLLLQGLESEIECSPLVVSSELE